MIYYCTKPVYVHIWSANHWIAGGSWTVAGIAFPFAGGSIPQENVSCLLQIDLKGGWYIVPYYSWEFVQYTRTGICRLGVQQSKEKVSRLLEQIGLTVR